MTGTGMTDMRGSGDRSLAHATVAELHPDVRRIVLFIAFEGADPESEPNYQQIIFTADAEAAFRLDCSREECTAGGFDLGTLIEETVKSGEVRTHGGLVCEGRLGAAGDRCGLKAEYRIIVD